MSSAESIENSKRLRHQLAGVRIGELVCQEFRERVVNRPVVVQQDIVPSGKNLFHFFTISPISETILFSIQKNANILCLHQTKQPICIAIDD